MQNPLAALSLNPCKTSVRAGSAEARERRRHDPFLSSLSRQRKAANLSRRQELAKERDAALGNPVESKPTQFIERLQAQMNPEHQANSDQTNSEYPYNGHNNHFLRRKEDVLSGIEYARTLSRPVANPDRDIADPQAEKESMNKHAEGSATAETAVQRIVDIRNGTSKDRLRVNFMTCIETFGRHNTDKSLLSQPRPVVPQSESPRPQKTPRVGPDTGSPEVQISILTAKILNLSRHLQTANTDKHNKRNLRLLVHKRQKMLKYLRRKERGGPRYQKVMEDLGLSDAAWKGEISM